ncbi:MAG: hypothetical protein WCG78_03600 [Candidatus Omnitrophota bacterium]
MILPKSATKIIYIMFVPALCILTACTPLFASIGESTIPNNALRPLTLDERIPAVVIREGRAMALASTPDEPIVMVRLASGEEQAFYKSSGENSGMPGRWLPIAGILPGRVPGNPKIVVTWYNKSPYQEGKAASRRHPLYRYGTEQLKRAGTYLDALDAAGELPLTVVLTSKVREINLFIGSPAAIENNKVYDMYDSGQQDRGGLTVDEYVQKEGERILRKKRVMSGLTEKNLRQPIAAQIGAIFGSESHGVLVLNEAGMIEALVDCFFTYEKHWSEFAEQTNQVEVELARSVGKRFGLNKKDPGLPQIITTARLLDLYLFLFGGEIDYQFYERLAGLSAPAPAGPITSPAGSDI